MKDPAGIIASPAFLVDVQRLRANLEILRQVKESSGCRILLALKAFAMWHFAPLLMEYLDGVCASSPWEARLGRERFGGMVHAYAPAYSVEDMAELARTCDAIDFNSLAQWRLFRERQGEENPSVECGLRINPCRSTQPNPLYDPCAPRSRLGVLAEDLEGLALEGLSGLHFHTLCEQGAEALAVTLEAVESSFAEALRSVRWVNFGGGHWITQPGYDRVLLCRLIRDFSQRHQVKVLLEPGEAVALNTGVLLATVLDVMDHDGPVAVLDISCVAHMPDVLEMPYRPNVHLLEDGLFAPAEKRAREPDGGPFTCRLAGVSCLAGDVIGDYAFERPLRAGDRLVFEDMAHYTMVKTTFFNGVRHPDLAAFDSATGAVRRLRRFSYSDFEKRLS